ncbi:MAG: M48 family metallopeptidase [Anaerolineaceae bacterium]|jgi:predicted metal-dependent hydrolase
MDYEVIFSRRKRLSLSVLPGGNLVVRAPLRTRQAVIAQFVNDNRDWIAKARQKMSQLPPPPEPLRFTEGAEIPYLGRRFPLRFACKVPGGLRFAASAFFEMQTNQAKRGEALLERFYREETRCLAGQMIARYAPRWQLQPKQVRVSSAQRRWGSCSAKGVVNFSYRLAMLPLDCIEYVVVHELAHLRHHNHSASFWALVAEMMPSFKERQEKIKKIAPTLPAF